MIDSGDGSHRRSIGLAAHRRGLALLVADEQLVAVGADDAGEDAAVVQGDDVRDDSRG